jgi:tRNA (cytidine/uridine-2'-O-)-methyltransferase
MFNIVLYAPEIPANTGNIGRTCVLTGSRLHLVGPIGFSLDSRMLLRAGLGYWPNLDVQTYASWEDILTRNGLALPADADRLHLLTKKARRTYAEATYRDGDYLVFGSESTGIPEALLASLPARCERIPMLPDAASLRNRDAWAAHERALGDAAASSAGRGRGGAGTTADAAGEGARTSPPASAPEGAASPLAAQDICGNFVDPDGWRISALNLSNSVAIVLYEALRQTGFCGMDADAGGRGRA